MAMQQYCLRWNNHQPNFISVFSSLLSNESLVDVTLAAEGKHLQAHKVVLSACSSYFQSLFTVNPCQHPIVILKDVKFIDLKIMVDFMYYGEVNVSQEQLPYILKTAEMLKIKGLAEIPMEQTINKTTSMDKTELLTAQDSNWSSDGMPLQTSTPSPCSPGSRRKRLRKSSSGSGSGERQEPVIEPPQNELILSQNILSSVIKSDPGGYPDNSVTQKSRDSTDLQRGGSHESVEGDTLHQITLQVPQHQQHQQDVALQHSIESQSTSSEIPGTSSNVQHQPSQPITDKGTTVEQIMQQNQPPMGTKRGRFLMRQPRIKRESDSSQPSDSEAPSLHYLSVPSSGRMERQHSDPLPASLSPPPGNLLAIPGAVLVKQHSHPLLPSQIQQPLSPPLNIHLSRHSDTDPAERAISPVVVVSASAQASYPDLSRSDVAEVAPTQILRVRTDELKRSASSPQSSTRSSHCPVIRPGPALGCNYCWNTVDTHGRILRRKTKYHCPECQTNLCIVPCFQEYHERHSTSHADPVTLTSSVMKMFPKTNTM
ncbi:longitudinals lacking protein, isoforms H/M/V-like isoform X2 [Sitophilus oryzae]|uniref:Longitudinals lacking protein, isoforms H/M/V-like isoform X2 n=1 Tax=Sitophilus oryzae TaxID=7048 RepID=A0A6J2XRY4_SITOR|nr:longitudinals lacking protein, isoforms H/M/V-like isoform X2 [Sitophilus oryzae]